MKLLLQSLTGTSSSISHSQASHIFKFSNFQIFKFFIFIFIFLFKLYLYIFQGTTGQWLEFWDVGTSRLPPKNTPGETTPTMPLSTTLSSVLSLPREGHCFFMLTFFVGNKKLQLLYYMTLCVCVPLISVFLCWCVCVIGISC
jgi:hypothetical protein